MFDNDRAFANYDSWLEAPYQRAAAEYEAMIDFAERYGIDPEDTDEIRRQMQAAEEAAVEAAAEAWAEARGGW